MSSISNFCVRDPNFACGFCQADIPARTEVVAHAGGGEKHPVHERCLRRWIKFSDDNECISCSAPMNTDFLLLKEGGITRTVGGIAGAINRLSGAVNFVKKSIWLIVEIPKWKAAGIEGIIRGDTIKEFMEVKQIFNMANVALKAIGAGVGGVLLAAPNRKAVAAVILAGNTYCGRIIGEGVGTIAGGAIIGTELGRAIGTAIGISLGMEAVRAISERGVQEAEVERIGRVAMRTAGIAALTTGFVLQAMHVAFDIHSESSLAREYHTTLLEEVATTIWGIPIEEAIARRSNSGSSRKKNLGSCKIFHKYNDSNWSWNCTIKNSS